MPFVSCKSFTPTGKPFTVGAWCKSESTNGVLVSWGGRANGLVLYIENGVPHAAVRSKGELFVATASQSIETGAWTHLAAVVRANGRLALLVDGKQVAATPVVAIAKKPNEREPKKPFTLGGSYSLINLWI